MISKNNRVTSARLWKKPDWCLILDNGLEVCVRGMMTDDWEETGKTEGYKYLRPKPEPKSPHPIGRVFKLKREYGAEITWVEPLGEVEAKDCDLLFFSYVSQMADSFNLVVKDEYE